MKSNITRIFLLVCLVLVISILVVPVLAKKDDNPSDNSKFKHLAGLDFEAYTVNTTHGQDDEKLNNNHPNLNEAKTIHFAVTNGSEILHKYFYVYRKSSVLMSDGNIAEYSKFKHSPTLEIYYGYANSSALPWLYYYRVDDCDVICKTINANFTDKSVWITYTNETAINTIVDSETIPNKGELP
jgi:hypothetical protein